MIVHRILKNAHFWIVLFLSVALLLIYQAWPWRDWQFADGIYRFLPWLSNLNEIVVTAELRTRVFGILFFVPIVYGSLALSWPGGLLAWLMSLVWVFPTLLSWSGQRMVINLLLLLLPVLLVAVVNGERRWRELEKRNFAERERERQVYIAKLVEAQEMERQRIAQELHDDTLQTLMAITNKSEALSSASATGQQMSGNEWIREELLRTMGDIRRISMNLRPSILDNFGLVSGVRWLVNNSNSQGNCHLDISVEGEERRMSSLAEVTVFRVAQEAIHNIQRHSQAQTGGVTLQFLDEALALEIVDDGVGFRPPPRYTSYVSQSKLGLIGIEQRILAAGGRMALESSPGKGTKLSAAIPYSVSAEIL